MASQFPNQVHQASVGPPSGHYAHDNLDGVGNQLSSFFGPPSTANDNPFSSFGSDGPTTVNTSENYPPQSETSFSLETTTQHAQLVNASSVNPDTSQAVSIPSFFSHTTAGLLGGGEEGGKEEPDCLFSSSLQLQAGPPLHFPPPPSHAPLGLPMPHVPVVNPATGAASSSMQLEEPTPLLQPLPPTSVDLIGHSLEQDVSPLSAQGHGQVPNMMEKSTSELFNDDLQSNDFLSFIKQPQSLPVRAMSVQGHAPPPPQGTIGKSTSTPSTGVIQTGNLPGSLHQRNASLTDAMFSGAHPVESGGGGREESLFLQKGGPIIADSNPLATGADLCSHSNTSSTISSPITHSLSNADRNIRAVPYGDQAFTYQHRTNADPEFNPTNPRSAQKGPLTNLEIDTNVASKQEFGMMPAPSGTTNVSERYASVYMTSGSADVAEKCSSPTSSLNQSLCSLLDNQDDLGVGISPVRLMAPAPFMHETVPPGAPPMTVVKEISMEKLSDVALLPPASTVHPTRHEQAVAAVGGSNLSHSGNTSQAVHWPPVSSNSSSSVAHCGVEVQSSSNLADNEKWSGSMGSREEENRSLATMTHLDGGTLSARTDAARAAALVGGSVADVSSVDETERPDSLEDWEIVEKASNSTAGSASDAPLMLQSSGLPMAVLPNRSVQLDEQHCRPLVPHHQQLSPSGYPTPTDAVGPLVPHHQQLSPSGYPTPADAVGPFVPHHQQLGPNASSTPADAVGPLVPHHQQLGPSASSTPADAVGPLVSHHQQLGPSASSTPADAVGPLVPHHQQLSPSGYPTPADAVGPLVPHHQQLGPSGYPTPADAVGPLVPHHQQLGPSVSSTPADAVGPLGPHHQQLGPSVSSTPADAVGPLVPHHQQLDPSVSLTPTDALFKLHPQPASVSIPPGSASFPSQPLSTLTSVFSSQSAAPGLLWTTLAGSTSYSDTPAAYKGDTSSVSSNLHSGQALSTGLEPTSHRPVSSVGPTSSLPGLPASTGPVLEPTLYSSGSNLEPTSYSFGSNLKPTSSSSRPNLVPAAPSSSGPTLEAPNSRDGHSHDKNPPPSPPADASQERDHISSNASAPPLTPANTMHVSAINLNPLQRTTLGQVPQSSFLGLLQPVAPQLTRSGAEGNGLNTGQLNKQHLVPARSIPMTNTPGISKHLKDEHALNVGVMESQRTQDPWVAKPVTTTGQPDTYGSDVGVPVSSSGASSGTNPRSESTALVNQGKSPALPLGSAPTAAPVPPQSTLPIQPETHASMPIHCQATGARAAGEIPPRTTIPDSTTKSEMSAAAMTTSREIRSVTTADVLSVSDVNPATQDSVATEPTPSTAEQDAQSIQTQQDEAHVRPPTGVVDSYAPAYPGDYDPMYGTAGGEGEYAYDGRYRLEQPYPDPRYHPRPPYGRPGYGIPDQYGYHHNPPPSDLPHHQDYRGYYPNQHGFDPYTDPYRHPPDPYYNPYRHEYPPQQQMYQAYQHDPHFGYPPQQYGQPPYRPDPRYARDVYNSSQYRTNDTDTYSDEYYHQAQQQYPRAQHSPAEQPLEVENPSEPSMIQGGPGEGVFETSDVYNSPSIPLPAHPHMNPPLESTCLEQPGNPLQWDGTQCADDPYLLSDPQYYQEGGINYTGDGYPPVASEYPEGYRDSQTMQNWEDDKEREPIPATPPSPERKTPEHYYCSHVRTTFCFGGQLVTVLPNNIGVQGKALVEIYSVRDVLMDEESRRFVEAVTDGCDPFIPGETPKSIVYHFTSGMAEQCRGRKEAMVSAEGHENDDTDSVEALEDEVLLWEFLMLLCQQNGVIVPSDVADLLMRERPLSIKPSMPQDERECLDHLRQLLLSGRKKNAFDYACSKGLWGHALMLASRMDEQSRTYVVNRFTASLASIDPLSTFYTLLLGHTPAAVKKEGLARAGDWRPHLSMILANKCNKLDTTSIVSLGDSLLARKKLFAAHLCYYLADVHFGSYGNVSARYSLFGIDQSVSKVGRYPWPHELWKMEVLEYALSLTKHDFSFPSFQVFKFLHVLKLVEYGFVTTAVKYCEQISYSVLKGMDKYVPTLLSTLLDVAVRLHYLTTELGMVESELPSWLRRLELSVTAILSTDYTPNLLSPSPAFSSVSQTYSSGDARPQLTIGLQHDNSHLTVPQTHGVSQLRPKDNEATSYIYNRGDGTVGGVETFQLQHAVHSAPSPVLEYHSNTVMEAPTSFDGGVGVATTNEGRVDHAQIVEPDEATEVQQCPVPDSLATGAGEVKEIAVEQLYRGQSGEQLYREHGGQMDTFNTQDPSLQVQWNDGVNGYGGTSVPGDVGGSVAGSGMEVEGVMMPVDRGEQRGRHQPSQTGAVPSIAPPQFSGGGYDFGLASATTASSTNPTNATPAYNWSQPSSSNYTLIPPSDGHEAKREPGVLNQQQGSGDDHVPEENEHKSEKSDKKSSNEEKLAAKPEAGGRWGFLGWIMPKQKNQMHLPDDKNPSIVWDQERKEWVDMDGNSEKEEDFAPPPTDTQLGAPLPQSTARATSVADVGGARPHPDQPPPSSLDEPVPSAPGQQPNMFSMQGSGRSRRLGARSKYVDVMNQGGSSAPGAPPPPGPPIMNISAMSRPFTGSFFVPSPVAENEVVEDVPGAKASATSSNSDARGHDSLPAAQPTTDSGSHQRYTPNPITNPALANPPSALQDHFTKPPDQYSATAPVEAEDVGQNEHQGIAYSQAQPVPAQHSELTGQEDQWNYYQQSQAQYAPGTQASTGVSEHAQWGQSSVTQSNQERTDESRPALSHQLQRNDTGTVGNVTSNGENSQPLAQQPQFLNPSAFAPVGGFSGSLEPQDDAGSTSTGLRRHAAHARSHPASAMTGPGHKEPYPLGSGLTGHPPNWTQHSNRQ